MQFIIPVYQRNYSWLTENCNQLFNDLVDLVHSGRPTHFFGSIVTSPADGYGINRLVIDGAATPYNSFVAVIGRHSCRRRW